ncbi:MAG: PAS domain-containing protein [Magnetococcales bacterium]|nr:PAS domain-containing protein [Magnetococcales bacterium]
MSQSRFPFNFWQNRSLDFRLISAITLLLAVVMSVSGWHNITNELKTIRQQVQVQGTSLAHSAALFSVQPLSEKRYAPLELFAQRLVNDAFAIGYLRVTDADGRAVALVGEDLNWQNSADRPAMMIFTQEVMSEEKPGVTLGTVEIGMLSRQVDAMISSRLTVLATTSMITFLLLAVLIFQLIRKTLTEPLEWLVNQAEDLGRGNMERPLTTLPAASAELRQLASTLDSMRVDLKGSFEKIRDQENSLTELDSIKNSLIHENRVFLESMEGRIQERTQDLSNRNRELSQQIARLQESEQSLFCSVKNIQFAQKLQGVGSWEWNVGDNRLYWSDQTFRLFGLEPGHFIPVYDELLKRIHKEDRILHNTTLQNALERESRFDFAFRIILPDGSERTLRSYGTVVSPHCGSGKSLAGVIERIRIVEEGEDDHFDDMDGEEIELS